MQQEREAHGEVRAGSHAGKAGEEKQKRSLRPGAWGRGRGVWRPSPDLASRRRPPRPSWPGPQGGCPPPASDAALLDPFPLLG